MINSKDNPIEWSQLMSELEDAHEHLGQLIKYMQESGCIVVESYAVDVAHVYAHINRSGGYSLKEIGDHFGLHYSRISRIVKKIEGAKGPVNGNFTPHRGADHI